MTTLTIKDRLALERKIHVDGIIRFETAWRVGSGREGETGSDLGVLLGGDGLPVLPGSSLKGKLRSTCERLAHVFGRRACCLDFAATNVPCTSSQEYFKGKVKREYEDIQKQSLDDRMNWICQRTCDVCKLFGSPHLASKIRITDGTRTADMAGDHVMVRDSVVLDRDSHTAVPGLKYDYEVVSAGSAFGVRIEVDNPENDELALLAAALIEWTDGISLGGFTSRGLGSAKLQIRGMREVNFSDAEHVRHYFLATDPNNRMQPIEDWQSKLTEWIDEYFQQEDNNHAT